MGWGGGLCEVAWPQRGTLSPAFPPTPPPAGQGGGFCSVLSGGSNPSHPPHPPCHGVGGGSVQCWGVLFTLLLPLPPSATGCVRVGGALCAVLHGLASPSQGTGSSYNGTAAARGGPAHVATPGLAQPWLKQLHGLAGPGHGGRATPGRCSSVTGTLSPVSKLSRAQCAVDGC